MKLNKKYLKAKKIYFFKKCITIKYDISTLLNLRYCFLLKINSYFKVVYREF